MTAPGWRALLFLEQSFLGLSRDVGALRRDMDQESAMADGLAGELLRRVAALEEIAAARWPRSAILRGRLRRDLRASVAHVQGRTWAGKRTNALGSGWMERRPPTGPNPVSTASTPTERSTP